MSRSRKKPIIKDKCRYFQKLRHRISRRKTKQQLKDNPEEILKELKNQYVNQYNITDWIFFNFDNPNSTRK